MDCFPGRITVNIDVPKLLIWPYDQDDGPRPFTYSTYDAFDLMFIRDWDGKNYNNKCYPMNYGIEDRYYCITQEHDKLLKDREDDVTFFGSTCGSRQLMARDTVLEKLRREINPFIVLKIASQVTFASDPDPYWSQWVKGRFLHNNDYFRALVNSKIVLSVPGGGPECGRTYEAFAAHAIPMIQKTDTVKIEPSWETVFPEIVFHDQRDFRLKIRQYILGDPNEAQALADRVFEFAKDNWRSTHRAKFLVDTLKTHNLA